MYLRYLVALTKKLTHGLRILNRKLCALFWRKSLNIFEKQVSVSHNYHSIFRKEFLNKESKKYIQLDYGAGGKTFS
jgi:hypothetical protein